MIVHYPEFPSFSLLCSRALEFLYYYAYWIFVTPILAVFLYAFVRLMGPVLMQHLKRLFRYAHPSAVIQKSKQ